MISLFRTISWFLPLAMAMIVDRILRHGPNQVRVTHLTLPIKGLPPAFDGFTIGQISDMHIGKYAWIDIPRMRLYSDLLMGLKPDLIANTGDFADMDISPQTQRKLIQMLKPMTAPEGVFGVLGNHDYVDDADKVRCIVHQSNICLLENRHVVIRRGNQEIYIAGVSSAYDNSLDLQAALEGIPKDACIILLAHEPDFADMVRWDRRVKLQLSGHTHGGQLILPLIGAPYLPSWGEKYVRGLYTVDELNVYVNSGLGMHYPPLRNIATAEITHITLVCAD